MKNKETPTFTQEEVTKVFHITKLFLEGHSHDSVARNVDMDNTELNVLKRKLELWEDFNQTSKEKTNSTETKRRGWSCISP